MQGKGHCAVLTGRGGGNGQGNGRLAGRLEGRCTGEMVFLVQMLWALTWYLPENSFLFTLQGEVSEGTSRVIFFVL